MIRIRTVCYWLVALGLVVLLAALNVVLGPLNQDEGVYLYAGMQVWEGKLPFIHNAFTQGPVTALVYAAAKPLVDAYGVLGGRIFAAAMGLGTIFFTARLSARLSPREVRWFAAFTGLLLIGASAPQSYFLSIAKAYAPAALFATAGIWMWIKARDLADGRRAVLAGILLALAAGSRFSLIIWLPLAGITLLMPRRRNEADRVLQIAFWLSGIVTLLAIYTPFMLLAWKPLKFGLVEYHAARQGGQGIGMLAFKVGFISRVARVWMPVLAILVVTAGMRQALRGRIEPAPPKTSRDTLWAMLLLTTIAHMLTPFPYDDYQVVVFPLLVALVASALARFVYRLRIPDEDRHTLTSWVSAILLLLSGVGAFSVEINQEWMVSGRDRIWWVLKSKPDVFRLRDVAAKVREMAGDEGEILTQDAYIAVESHLRLPQGLELGPFALCSEFDDKTAADLHVLNAAGMARLLETSPAKVSAASGYSFSIQSPEIVALNPAVEKKLREALEARTEHMEKVERFGQGATTLEIRKLKAPKTRAADSVSVPSPEKGKDMDVEAVPTEAPSEGVVF